MRRRPVRRKVQPARVERNRRPIKVTILISAATIACLAITLVVGARSAENSLKRKSLPELQAAAQEQPNNARVLYYLGRSYRTAGQSREALGAFREAARLDPIDEATVVACADMASDIEGPQSAKPILDDFLKLHPDSPAAHLSLARVFQRLDSPMDSYKEAQQAARLDPRSVGAWEIIGDIEGQRQNYVGAESAYAKLVALQPEQWPHRVGHGNALFQLGRLPEAATAIREGVRLAPNVAEPRVEMGKILRVTAKTDAEYEEARRVLREALSLNAESPKVTFNAYLQLGKCDAAQAHWKEALGWFQLARPLNTDNEDVHFQLAKCYRMVGDVASAESEMKQHQVALDFHLEELRLTGILKVDPKDDHTLLSLARLYVSHSDADRAITLYRILLGRSPHMQDARQEYQQLARQGA
jgi:tetratricopeptide (TPR) repeat protein